MTNVATIMRQLISDIRRDYYNNNYYWSRDIELRQTNHIVKKTENLDDQYSVLSQKQNAINGDIGLYKCNDINSDLARLNQQNFNVIKNKKYRDR